MYLTKKALIVIYDISWRLMHIISWKKYRRCDGLRSCALNRGRGVVIVDDLVSFLLLAKTSDNESPLDN